MTRLPLHLTVFNAFLAVPRLENFWPRVRSLWDSALHLALPCGGTSEGAGPQAPAAVIRVELVSQQRGQTELDAFALASLSMAVTNPFSRVG